MQIDIPLNNSRCQSILGIEDLCYKNKIDFNPKTRSQKNLNEKKRNEKMIRERNDIGCKKQCNWKIFVLSVIWFPLECL